MVYVLDQFEVEMTDQYSGSYTDGVFAGGSIFDQPVNTRKLIASRIDDSISINSFPTNLKLLRRNTTYLLTESKSTPSQNLRLKFFDSNEQYADTVLPRPPDIVLINGGQFTEGVGEYIFPSNLGNLIDQPTAVSRSEEPYIDASGKKVFHKQFKITLGSARVALTSSVDGSKVSDNVWSYSFPFENKYANLKRLFRPRFDKNYHIELSQSYGLFRYTNAGGDQILSWSYDLAAVENPLPYDSHRYTLQYLFRDDSTDNRSSNSHSRRHNRRRYITLLDSPVSISSTHTVLTASRYEYPSINYVYRGFFGFYKNRSSKEIYNANSLAYDGPFTNPPVIDFIANRTGALNHGRTDAFTSLENLANFPEYTMCDGLSMDVKLAANVLGTNLYFDYASVEDFNTQYLKINGWKYGVYHANPSTSFCYWRRSRYGQFRDMLEQRPFTKFYDTKSGVALEAAVRITFISGTAAFVTGSNGSLNTRDSGIYDFEGRSGKPFDDREAVD